MSVGCDLLFVAMFGSLKTRTAEVKKRACGDTTKNRHALSNNPGTSYSDKLPPHLFDTARPRRLCCHRHCATSNLPGSVGTTGIYYIGVMWGLHPI